MSDDVNKPPCVAVAKEQPPRQAAPATPAQEQPPRQATPATPPEEGNIKTVPMQPPFPSSGGVPEGRGGHSQVNIDGQVPRLRFPGFEGEWSIEKFGNICRFVRGPFGGALKKDIFVKQGYPVYEQSHAIHQDFDSFRYFISEDKFHELKRFEAKPNDIIMSCSGTMGKIAVVPNDARPGVINQALLKLTVANGYDLAFIKNVLEYPKNQEKLLSKAAGGAIKNVVGVSQLKEIEFSVPKKKEQQKIADCLSSIDELITAQDKKIDTLKDHKKGLMQQLFPATAMGYPSESATTPSGAACHPCAGTTTPSGYACHPSKGGEYTDRAERSPFPSSGGVPEGRGGHSQAKLGVLVPRLRFPGFEGEWEEHLLGEVASFTKGKGVAKSDIASNGKLPCVRYGELYTHYGETIEQIISYTNVSDKELVLSKFNDVIIPASGETQEDIATASCVKSSGVALGGDLNIIRSEIDGVFLSYFINGAKKKDVARMAQGISVIHLYANQLKKLELSLPIKKEQQKIADCLSSIDELITLHTQKLDTLKAHKKGLMQQLFPSSGGVAGEA